MRALGKDILFPGIIDLLQALKARGAVLHVASTGDSSHVYGVLKTAGIQEFFSSISCGEPEKVQMVAEIIGKNQKETFAMVGDKAHDLRAARGNGITAIAAAYGYCSDTDAPRFDYVLRSPGELLFLF